MNCLGFRRALSVRPASQDPDLLAHRRACAECEAFARRQAAFERTLGDAVRVPVPEGLASRILVAHAVGLEASRRVRRRRLRLTLAAGLALGLAASWLVLRPGALERAVVAHIEGERSHLADQRDLSPEQVNRVLAPLRIAVGPGLGPVRYAGTCRIRRQLGAHLVLPAEAVDRRLPVRDARLRGIIVPAGRGSMAIVGEPGELLDGIEERLLRAVRFASRDGPQQAWGRRREEGHV
jgi:hypothetical protein